MELKQNYTDELLLSFNSFNNCKDLIENCLLKHDKLAVCLLDISKFKLYNFMFGYKYGDRILEIVFNKVQKCVNNYGEVYRLTGDILLILLHNINDKEDIINIIKEIVDIFQNPVDIGKDKIRIAINIGISLYPNDSREAEVMFKYAEIALDYTKSIYSDRYRFFESQMYESIIQKGRIEADILSAIGNKEFTIYYQPQIDIENMRVYGMEALLRWNHPQYGILPPACFIEIVEKNGMIKEIGKFVFLESCNHIKRLHNLGYNNLSMSINISKKQLEDDLFLFFVEDILKNTGVDPKSLIIEITERILIKPTDRILNVLGVLRNKGFKIFIDDFGTEYSSLNYLYRFNIDGIKIDKSFVDKIHYSEKEFIITKNIIKLAREINIDVVAEGVEEKEQLECLKNINCSKIQGFIFEKPVSANDTINFLMMFNK